MTLYLGLLTVTLLALLAGLLLTVGWWLYEFRISYKQMPLLGEELTRQLMNAREALTNLQHTAKESGPELAKAVGEARKVMQDLQFLTQKAEQVAEAMDAQRERVIVQPQADGGRVTAENVVAAASTTRDPLEELLAGLGDTAKTAPTAEPLLPLLGEEEDGPKVRVASRTEEDMRRKLAR
ncbi:MAG: DUF6468 domain-containing protein [Alphaproteobacteria bacterium]